MNMKLALRNCMSTAVVVLLAAGGAARAAEKEAPIDWPARAATVKVGMTRAEVERILPRWNAPSVHRINWHMIGENSFYTTYRIAEKWSVVAHYDNIGGAERLVEPVKIEKVEKVVPKKPTP